MSVSFVREALADIVVAEQYFTDDRIAALLGRARGNARLAVSYGLRALSADMARGLQGVTVEGLETGMDGPAHLRKLAMDWEWEAGEDDFL